MRDAEKRERKWEGEYGLKAHGLRCSVAADAPGEFHNRIWDNNQIRLYLSQGARILSHKIPGGVFGINLSCLERRNVSLFVFSELEKLAVVDCFLDD